MSINAATPTAPQAPQNRLRALMESSRRAWMRTRIGRSWSLTFAIMAMLCTLMEHARGASFDFSTVVGIRTRPIQAGEKPLVGPVSTYALVTGGTYYGNQNDTIDLTVPQSYVPPFYGSDTPHAAKNTSFHLLNDKSSDVRIGLRLLSFIEAGVTMRADKGTTPQLAEPRDNPYSTAYQTFWGGYATGDYAAIGGVTLEASRHRLGWYGQIQTPDINLTRKVAIAPFFYTASATKYDVLFRSGYHRYGDAFNPEYKSTNIGTVTQTYSRAGLLVKYRLIDEYSVGVQCYSEQRKNDFSATSEGELFKAEYSIPKRARSIGYGFQINVAF